MACLKRGYIKLLPRSLNSLALPPAQSSGLLGCELLGQRICRARPDPVSVLRGGGGGSGSGSSMAQFQLGGVAAVPPATVPDAGSFPPFSARLKSLLRPRLFSLHRDQVTSPSSFQKLNGARFLTSLTRRHFFQPSDPFELFNVARESREEKQPCDGNKNMVATSDFKEKTFLKGLKKKFTIPGSNSSGSSQPKPPARGNRVNLTPSRCHGLKLELVKTLQVKDNTTRSHPRSSTSDEIFEEFQEVGELEKAKEAHGSQEAEKNESSEECSLVLFEE